MIGCEKNLTDDAKDIWLLLQSMKNQRPYHLCQNVAFFYWADMELQGDRFWHCAVPTHCSRKSAKGGSGCGCKFLATPKLNLTLYDCIKSKDQLGWSKLILGQTKLKSWDIFPLKCNWWHFVEYALVKSSGVSGRHLRHPIVWGESSYKRSTPLDDNLIIPQPPSCI